MLVSAFFILLTVITLWVVMHFIAPALLKDEHRRVHYQINEHTADVTQLMSRVQAQQGTTLMNAAVEKMGHIESSSLRVTDIVGVIDGIAYQTNILALNAAVEAARG